MPIGLRFKYESTEFCIAFGLLQCDDGVRLIYAAGIRTHGQWNGWNWMWTPISGLYIRIYDQWGVILAEIPRGMFVPKAFHMTNKSITDVVQRCDHEEWVIV